MEFKGFPIIEDPKMEAFKLLKKKKKLIEKKQIPEDHLYSLYFKSLKKSTFKELRQIFKSLRFALKTVMIRNNIQGNKTQSFYH